MNVILANSAGFCFGVKRAVDIVNEQINIAKGPIYTYGPIIHNEDVVNEFKQKGVDVIEEGDFSGHKSGTVIIRSHGVTKSVIDKLTAEGHQIVDATCPFVKKIHNLVSKYSDEGYHIIVIGNPNHPEVEGIIGWINGQQYTVISNSEEAHNFSLNCETNLCIVSQTTFNHNKFQELVEIINKKGYHNIVLNTICDATHKRQEEASEIAGQVDAMLVIGSKNSSNTQKLFEICKSKCADTYYIQTIDDLQLSVLQSIQNIGITAGASTPNKIIEEVQKNVRNEL